MLAVTRQTVRRMTLRGELRTVKFGGNVRYRLRDIERFIDRHENEQG